jgi:ferredoxin-NADP reductase
VVTIYPNAKAECLPRILSGRHTEAAQIHRLQVSNLARQLFTARLVRKLCLSERTQCFHLEFEVEELGSFEFIPGQFVSTQAVDAKGKLQTRAYSIASAPRGNRFDLCVNRVDGGFFSNYNCDLEQGETVNFHGPHGLFLLRKPLTDAIFIATGTGVAPMLGFTQYLFPESGEDLSEGREFWMVYGTRWETELYYREYFESVAARHPNFHYVATLSRASDEWKGNRGYVQEYVRRIVEERAGQNHGGSRATATETPGFDIHAYICGLNEMVSGNRDQLLALGWEKKQVIFERYD